jgi:hypothetical protein
MAEYVRARADQDAKDFDILHKKFVIGLHEDYGMTYEQIKDVEENWFYCGHIVVDRDTKDITESDLYKLKHYFPMLPIPDFQDSCVCRQKLYVRNEWITDMKEVLIIGQCCVNMFIAHSSKTCMLCKAPHRNRKDDLCKECRDKILLKEKEKAKQQKQQKQRQKERDEYLASITCPDCKKTKKAEYKYCYQCNKKRKTKVTMADIEFQYWGPRRK